MGGFKCVAPLVYYKLLVIINSINENAGRKRQKRYLIFTPSTQYGVFATVSIPLPEPNNLVNVAWFFEGQYYNVANASYFYPLLGDVEISRGRTKRDNQFKEVISRSRLYTSIEAMLEKHGYHGKGCLLRTICETASSHFSHNGLLGDLLHLALTPSLSIHEDGIEDCYYEAQYYGLDQECQKYYDDCPQSPLDSMSANIDNLL